MSPSSRLLLAGLVVTAACCGTLLNTGRTTAASDAGTSAGAEQRRQAEPAPAADIKRLHGDFQAMRKEIRHIKTTLERIEAMIAGRRGPSEFSPVTIRVQTEDGRPLAGFRVEMALDRDQGRQLRVSGRSDETGLALSRELPYGDYHIVITEPSGWSASVHTLTVELGAPLDKTVVAPDLDHRGSLQIRTSLDACPFKGLPFGEMPEDSGGGYRVPFAPEPDEESERFASFPTVGDGIREPAAEILLEVERPVPQPDGTTRTWRWSGSEHGLPTLLASTNQMIVVEEANSESASPKSSGRYFALPDEEYEEDYSVGILRFRVERTGERSISLDVAPGEVRLRLVRFLAKAEQNAVSSLGIEDAKDGDEIWLEAYLTGRSDWVTRTLDLKGWDRSGRTSTWLAKKTVAIGPGETARFAIQPPGGSSRTSE